MTTAQVTSMCRDGMHAMCRPNVRGDVACRCGCHVTKSRTARPRAVPKPPPPSRPFSWPDPTIDRVPVPDRPHRSPAAMDERWPLAADWTCCTPRCVLAADGWSATHATTCRKSTPAAP